MRSSFSIRDTQEEPEDVTKTVSEEENALDLKEMADLAASNLWPIKTQFTLSKLGEFLLLISLFVLLFCEDKLQDMRRVKLGTKKRQEKRDWIKDRLLMFFMAYHFCFLLGNILAWTIIFRFDRE